LPSGSSNPKLVSRPSLPDPTHVGTDRGGFGLFAEPPNPPTALVYFRCPTRTNGSGRGGNGDALGGRLGRGHIRDSALQMIGPNLGSKVSKRGFGRNFMAPGQGAKNSGPEWFWKLEKKSGHLEASCFPSKRVREGDVFLTPPRYNTGKKPDRGACPANRTSWCSRTVPRSKPNYYISQYETQGRRTEGGSGRSSTTGFARNNTAQKRSDPG